MTNPETIRIQDERRQLASDITMEELIEKLVTANIPVDLYGTGAAKTVAHLLLRYAMVRRKYMSMQAAIC